MNTSVIRYRVADTLKRYAPFDSLSEADLLDLAEAGRVKFHESDEYVFRQGQPRTNWIWVIQQGRVDLVEGSAESERLCDILDEGDVLGLEGFGHDAPFPCGARTASDVILYAFPAARIGALVTKYPQVASYLAAHSSASHALSQGRTSWLDADAPPTAFLEARSRGRATAGLPEVAGPVTTRAAIRALVGSRSESVAVTRDSSTAVLTASDLSLFCGWNPAHLLEEIRASRTSIELSTFTRLASPLLLGALARPRDTEDCAVMGTAIVTALTEACIRLAEDEMSEVGLSRPEVPYCWLAFGAAARGDLIRPLKPRLALVFDDSSSEAPGQAYAYFAALLTGISSWFHACGLDGADLIWPDGSHPCMPIPEWIRLYTATIRNPIEERMYERREFFDVRAIGGDRTLAQCLNDHVAAGLDQHSMLIPLLANDTLAHLPPLTFFQGMVIDLDGGRREGFDIALSVIHPIAEAARVFALAKRRMTTVNTLERLEAAAEDFPESGAVFRNAAEAFRVGLYHQALAGSSRIDPSQLGRYDQRLLKTAFLATHRLLELATSTFLPSQS